MYIKLSKNKRPTHSLDTTFSKEEVVNEDSYGMMVPEPFVVIDVDDNEDFERLHKIVKAENLRARVLKTENGGHFWFRSLKPLRNHVNINTPLSIPIDIRSYGKKSYVVLKRDGVEREWLDYHEDVDELPRWLTPIKIKKDMRGMRDGDGRNNELFSFIIPLINNQFSKMEIQKTFELINEFIFEEPLEQSEIDAMMDNEIFEDSRALFFDGNRFLHHEFAKWLQNTYFIKWFAGELWIYKDGVYEADEIYLGQVMIEQIPELTARQRRETMDYLKLLGSHGIKNSPPTVINVENGSLNLITGDVQKHTPFIFSTNQLPVQYNPEAYCPHVDAMLDRVTCNDKELRGLVEEMMGYTLYGENTFQKAFILTGEGSNGKSSFIQMLTNMLGKENIATLTMDELEHRFKPPELVGKLANLGDDIPRELVRDSSIFKRAVTGDAITAERKGQDAFTFYNTAKLIFTANELPPTTDKTRGFMRRVEIIPFDAEFKPTDKDYDPNINEKITTPLAASYLLNLAMAGLNRLLKRQKFPVVKSVVDKKREYEASNNSVLDWVENSADIENREATEVYQDYMLYCSSMGTHPYSVRRFNKEIRTQLDYDTRRESVDGKTVQVWRSKEYIEGEDR